MKIVLGYFSNMGLTELKNSEIWIFFGGGGSTRSSKLNFD